MKSLKTAPQIINYVFPEYVINLDKKYILKCMRMYARTKIEKEYEKLYQEARRNILIQYNLK